MIMCCRNWRILSSLKQLVGDYYGGCNFENLRPVLLINYHLHNTTVHHSSYYLYGDSLLSLVLIIKQGEFKQ